MSDMSRPVHPSPVPAHDQHDPLLVAQLAAGDTLDPARAQQAQAWLASCPECVVLAADLRHVSAAVASEPVPRRRRDFRLTSEQAEAARGGSVMRFIRGLSLPRSRAFSPAAAGILSVGLIFMVAGYAWPDGGIATQSETNVAPAAIEGRPGASPAPAADADLRAVGREPAAPAPARVGEPTETREQYASEAEFLDDLAEHQAGTSDRDAMRKSLEAEELADEAAVADAAAAAAATGGDASTTEIAAEPMDAPVGDTLPGEPDGLEASAGPAALMAQTDGSGVEVLSSAPATSGEQTLELWLVVLGLVLALGGASLLLLGWLSRRANDPLLR